MSASEAAPRIHPTASVDPGAQLAPGVEIGPGCIVAAGAVLHAGVRLVAHVVLDGHVTLHEGVTVYPFATIGLPPQDLKYRGEPTRVEIGARTQVREHATIHRGSVGGGVTRIGADCLIMCVAHIGHDCRLGDGVILVNNAMLAGHVEVGDHAVIQGGAAVQQFVRIGRMAMLAGMSGLERNLLPFTRAKGYRATVRGLNTIGLRRRLGLSQGAVIGMARAMHDLYRGGRPEEQVAAIAAQSDDPLVAEMLDFARNRGRHGLCPFGRSGEEEEEGA